MRPDLNVMAMPAKVVLLMMAVSTVLVMQAQGADVSAPADHAAPALLTVEGRMLTVFRVSLFGNTPAQRSAAAERRIEEFLTRPQIGEIRTMVRTEGTAVYLGEDFAFLVAPGDLDAVAGETMDQAINHAVRNLAVLRDGHIVMRTSAFWISATWKTLAATGLFAAVVACLVWGARQLMRLLARLESGLLARLKQQGLGALQYVLTATQWTVRIILWLIIIRLAGIWLVYCLTIYPPTRAMGESLRGYVLETFVDFGNSIVAAIPDLAVVVIIFVVARFLSGFTKTAAGNVATGKTKLSWLSPEVARPTARIAVVFIWLAAIVAAYPYVPGGSSQAFKGMGILVGLVITLGTPGVFAQIAAGLSMMYSRAFKAGEYVQIGDTEGTVMSVGYLSTKIRTARKEEINIPNAVMLTTASRNFSRSFQTGMPLNVKVSIGYNTPWRQVHALLLEAAANTGGIRRDPEPAVFQLELADYYVVYELSVFIEVSSRRRQILSDLNANIQDSFNKAGVQIMSPHYVGDPPEKVWVPPDKWYSGQPGDGNDTKNR